MFWTPLASSRYINIDAGYLQHQRDANGNLQVDTTKFPQGIRCVVGLPFSHSSIAHFFSITFNLLTSNFFSDP